MMKNKSYLTLACALALVLAAVASMLAPRASARSQSGDAYAIRGGTVVTVTGAAIPNGVVVIRNGLIAAVGADVPIPADARVIDATGMTVYPGLIDSYTSLGIGAPAAQQAQGAGRGGGRQGQPNFPAPAQPAAPAQAAAPSGSGLEPEVMAADQLNVTAETFDTPRSAGITTALSAPRTGIYQGQSVLINLGSDTPEKLILKSAATLNVGFGGGGRGGGGGFPNSPMGVFAFLRQTLLDAQHYREEWSRYNRNPRGQTRPQVDKSLAALQPIINGEMPVIFAANSVREIKRAVELGEEFKLKFFIAGGQESYQISDYLKQKNVTVLLSLNFPQRPANIEDPESESLRTLQARANAPIAAAALHKAGVRFALQSGFLAQPRDFITNAARAIENGLPKDEAIKAMTIYPAQIFGVAEQLGSIERGKIANLFVTNGDLFSRGMQVKHVFIDGKPYEVRAPAAPTGGRGAGGNRGGRPGGPGNPADITTVSGTWALNVNSPNGALQVTLTLRQDGDSLSGEITSQMGTTPTNGRIRGNEVNLGFNLNMQGQQTPATVQATVDGNSIRGSISLGGQSFDFTGTRTPRG
jgi:imidazolonepropionase-like amidohydrolase